MLAFTISKSAVALCRPVQLGVRRGGRELVGRLGAGWRRLANGEVRTVRAVPVEGSGLRARFGGEFSLNYRPTITIYCPLSFYRSIRVILM